ncbi:hypothetical protein HHL22_22110 [Hymenobacter sp. RP-2-7]|uniref:Lipocalin-like domain-containing protein n=1 Tax=Hymenobacter polaris TaxID=2682546 RepID=A0A7Y0FPZ6_9BACT|nr:hypothetical protein [Hymenobacter polaris]NML67904.1 hypothetical protein [Hymenobacter polaris]
MSISLRVSSFLLGTVLSGGLISCQRTAIPVPRTRTELLTGAKWHLTGQSTTRTLNGTTITEDNMPGLDPCDKDDILQFSATPSRTFFIEQGPTVCFSPTSSAYNGAWEFDATETVLRYHPGKVYESQEQIKRLTETQLITLYEGHMNTSTGYQPYYVTMTYSAL